MVMEDNVVVVLNVQPDIYTPFKKKVVKFNNKHPSCLLKVLFYKDNYAFILNIPRGVHNLASHIFWEKIFLLKKIIITIIILKRDQ